MDKTSRFLFFLFTVLFFVSTFSAQTVFASQRIKKLNTPRLVSAKITYENDVLTISNHTVKPINLKNARLNFYTNSKILAVSGMNALKLEFKPLVMMGSPNHPGSLYTLHFGETNQTINPGQSIHLRLEMTGNDSPRGFKLFTLDPVPVQVKVNVSSPDWTQTIFICNNSQFPIPLKNIEFTFNYAGTRAISNIWGNPWVAWSVAKRSGSQYVLRGGTPYVADLMPDLNCKKPLTIQFSSTPTSPVPTGPYIFKSAGAVPAGYGAVNIKMPSAPTAGLNNATVTLAGMGITEQQVIRWGEEWVINDLAPGAYTISASRIDNGQAYYQARPMTVTVAADVTTPVDISYQTVPTRAVAVNFVNAPDAQQQVIFTGQVYQFNKIVSANSTVILPADNYVVSSAIPNYSAQINPNPLNVPVDTALTITYQKVNVNSIFGGYFESWSAKPAINPADTELANLPEYVNYIYLAFAKPDNNYQQGSLNFSSAGLQFSYEDGNILKQAIAILHQKNPKTKILVSVGGATYNNWAQFNPQAIANFVKDFGLDGVDIDYEVENPGCVKGLDGLIQCQIDENYESIIESMRTLLPRPYQITVSAWSVAAFGQGEWSNAQPPSNFTGMMLPFFRSPAAKDIDMVNVMSYDAGTTYDPLQALAAYSYYYAGPISMGVEVPPEAWGGHVYTLAEVEALSKAVLSSASKHNTPPGMIMWSLQKKPNSAPSVDMPDAQMMATLICTNLGLNKCDLPLISSVVSNEPVLKPVNCNAFPHSREVKVATATELKAAMTAAIPGDLILLAEGTYSGKFVSGAMSGTAAAPISLCGSKKAILDAGSTLSGYVLYLKNVNNWNIAGMTIQNGQKGIMVDGSNYIDINGVIVHDIGDEAVHFRKSSANNIIENSWIHDTGKRSPGFGEGVYLGSAKSNLENDKSDFNKVIGNHIGPNVTAENIDVKEYTTGGLIADNFFDGSGLKGDNFADSWIDVKGNAYIIRNNVGSITNLDGFQTHIQVTGWGDFNIFDGNTLYVNAPGYGVRIQSPATGGKNNVVKCNNQVIGATEGVANMVCLP